MKLHMLDAPDVAVLAFRAMPQNSACVGQERRVMPRSISAAQLCGFWSIERLNSVAVLNNPFPLPKT
jgi:hypothetical protein